MKIHETTIIGIAELIATKEKIIEKMRADQALIKTADIRDIIVKIDNSLDSSYLFDNPQDSSGLVDAALEHKLPWIIDHVYDHAIQKLESKIENNIQQLKLDLTSDTKNKE